MKTEKPRIRVSFSGGRSSAYMTRFVFDKFRKTHDVIITFANTGCEHEKTLEFVNQCDKEWGWGVVWLESVFNMDHGKGVISKIVTFETASREGEPFEQYIQKNGLPNPMNPRCTDRLKEMAMDHYTHHTVGWKRGSYHTAIGIRSDEVDRVNPNFKKLKFVYPLADAGITKLDVLTGLKTWPFDLDLKSEAYGNCTWCWKKSHRKLLTLAKDNPEIFDFPDAMEKKYGNHKLGEDEDKDRVIFRKYRTAASILDEAKEGRFRPYEDSTEFQPSLFVPDMDFEIGCGEACEIGHQF